MKSIWKKIKLSNYSKLAVFCVFFLILPAALSNTYAVYVVNRGLTNAVAVIGLVLLYGVAGQISLGHAAFFAVGSYTSAILSKTFGIPVPLAMLSGVLLSVLAGVFLSIPAFKLSGPFLSICTVAFGEAIRQIILNAEALTGGPYGYSGIPPLVLFGYRVREDIVWYYILLALVVLCASCAIHIKTSYFGRALYAIKEDEIASSTMGIDVRKMKRFAFINAALFGGLAGVVYAHYARFLSQELVASNISSTLFSMAVLGGTDSIVGGLWSGVALTVAPEIMRFLQEYYIMILNLIVLLVVLVPWASIFRKSAQRIATKRKAAQ